MPVPNARLFMSVYVDEWIKSSFHVIYCRYCNSCRLNPVELSRSNHWLPACLTSILANPLLCLKVKANLFLLAWRPCKQCYAFVMLSGWPITARGFWKTDPLQCQANMAANILSEKMNLSTKSSSKCKTTCMKIHVPPILGTLFQYYVISEKGYPIYKMYFPQWLRWRWGVHYKANHYKYLFTVIESIILSLHVA